MPWAPSKLLTKTEIINSSLGVKLCHDIFLNCYIFKSYHCDVLWLVPRDFWYHGGIKDVVFLKHEVSARAQSVVKLSSDVTPTEQDL